jgi:phytoene dehydrogenase-like protein
MSVADLLDDWFECDALKGALAAAGVLHLCQGPRSGGTAFGLLHHHAGNPPGVFRPALYQSPEARETRKARVARILVREGSTHGVVLENGEEIAAEIVLSGADPKRTLLELVEPQWLDPEFARAVRNIRSRGVVARVSLKLDRALASPPLVVAPSLDYLERAYDDVKYGRVSAQPFLEARFDNDLVQVHAQYVPYGAGDAAAVGDLVVKALSPHLQGAAVVSREVLLPRDLESIEGWPQGQAYHAELALDQLLWMRPIGGWARYRTPIDGLYLCGPATHPGAGVAGVSGYLCAREILRTR